MEEIKDSVLLFLETVQYDEVMTNEFLLGWQKRCEGDFGSRKNGETLEGLNNITDRHYGWDEERRALIGKLFNWHYLKIPALDWRINLFVSLGRCYPEKTLIEQFGEQYTRVLEGEYYKPFLKNALTYANRVTEVLVAYQAIQSLYTLVSMEEESGDSPYHEFPEATYSNPHVQSMNRVLQSCFFNSLFVAPTVDVMEKIGVRLDSIVTIQAGKFFRDTNTCRVYGASGTLLFKTKGS